MTIAIAKLFSLALFRDRFNLGCNSRLLKLIESLIYNSNIQILIYKCSRAEGCTLLFFKEIEIEQFASVI